MSAGRILVAEFRKAATLPGLWLAVAIGIAGPLAITVINARQVRGAHADGRAGEVGSTSPFETAFAAAPLGTVAAVVIGVLVVSSEYTENDADVGGGSQIVTSLAAVTRRPMLLAAKVIVVGVAIGLVALVVIPLTVGAASTILGAAAVDDVPVRDCVLRSLGGLLYWFLTAVMALAVAVLTRSGLIPLVVFIVNSSVVSVSILLSNVTTLAYWLPDLAGHRLFGIEGVDDGLATGPGALVMVGWAAALLVVAGVVLQRRDA